MILQNIDVDILCHFPDVWSQHSLLESCAETEALSSDFFLNIISAAVNYLKLEACPNISVSLLLTNNDFIQELNSQHRYKDTPTDVLSFPLFEDPDFSMPVMLGDIIFAHDYISKKASQSDKSFKDHLTHLAVHGFLHLLGYDHIEDGEAKEMEALEIEILKTLSVKNPYET